MDLKGLIGEISGDDIDIEIGDIVKVEICGRLNAVSEKELRVGKQILDVENLMSIEKLK